MLTFSKPNKKLQKLQKRLNLRRCELWSFDLPPTITCNPSCKFRAIAANGKLYKAMKNGYPSCYAARSDAFYPNCQIMRARNYATLLASQDMSKTIETSIPKTAKVIRLHTSGDFFSYDYMLAWYKVAQNNPKLIIYAYTKQVSFLLKLRKLGLPKNLRIVCSYGSDSDRLITRYNLPWAQAIPKEKTKEYKSITINNDDYPAYMGKCSIIIYH